MLLIVHAENKPPILFVLKVGFIADRRDIPAKSVQVELIGSLLEFNNFVLDVLQQPVQRIFDDFLIQFVVIQKFHGNSSFINGGIYLSALFAIRELFVPCLLFTQLLICLLNDPCHQFAPLFKKCRI